MVIIDTNVLSALMRERPDPVVVKWLDQQSFQSIWTTSVTIFEIRFGIAILAAGRRQARLNAALEHLINETLDRRVAVFDEESALARPPFLWRSGNEGAVLSTCVMP
jgi:toxin FitB